MASAVEVSDGAALVADLHSDEKKDLWIFGYGSLIWKVNFKHKQSVVGYIKGYQRYFYQGSTDHRGVPGKPGRVVTLLPEDEGLTYGVGYLVGKEDVEEVMGYLDIREKGGYTSHMLDVTVTDPRGATLDTHHVQMLVYMGTTDNPEYAGPSPVDELASIIQKSIGPSGPNTEYLLNLANGMREIAPDAQDDHLFALEAAVLNLKTKEDSKDTVLTQQDSKKCLKDEVDP